MKRFNSVGKIIKFLRISKDISQLELAKMIGVTPNYLSLIENGKRIPHSKLLNKISDSLGFSTDIFTYQQISDRGFKSKKSKELVRRINNNLDEVRNIVLNQIIATTN